MNNPSASEIISALVQGCNPSTGEQLETGNIVHDPTVLRALFEAKIALERRDLAERRRQSQPPKTGAAWTSEEEAILVARYDSGHSFHEVGRELMRSAAAVQARLIKLGKIEDTGQLRFVHRA